MTVPNVAGRQVQALVGQHRHLGDEDRPADVGQQRARGAAPQDRIGPVETDAQREPGADLALDRAGVTANGRMARNAAAENR